MEFTVKFEDDCWVFTVSSVDGQHSYYEEFDAATLEEAIESAAELLEEISRGDEDFQEDFLDELEGRDAR